MRTKNQHLERRVAALQSDLNARDQALDDAATENNEREFSRRDWFEEAQRLQAKLAERDAQLEEFATELTLAITDSQVRSAMTSAGRSKIMQLLKDYNVRIEAALSASAEPSDYLKSCEAAHRALSLEPSAPVERDLDDDPFFVQQAEPHKPVPVERDERAEFESYYADLSGLPAEEIKSWRNGVGYLNTYERCGISWDAWMARAALDKSTEGASHE